MLTKIELLYADKYCIAVHKHPGIPCQTQNLKPPYPLDQSLGNYLNESVKIWTRIDQPVSGLVLFYRENPKKSFLHFKIKSKTYLGLVEGHPPQEVGQSQTLVSSLRRDGKRNKSIPDPEHGKRAELSYTVLKKLDRYTLLKIRPDTGRFHQIRQQLAQVGFPIKGDVKYGARRKNRDRSIHLHALEYVIQYQDEPPVRIFDHALPDDNLWNLAKSQIKSGVAAIANSDNYTTKNDLHL
ncbi:RNA pseudouridine synthase [Membranicola marinus]|uniref:RNA pseudouridine synthase n=1 Tax=Membranihabitans marinus TaxID=1227546 RepID=A0A953HKY4_9BACT|nr:RNA pseudouridine synthase [Membranihabitans marinus]MBY5957819.1 RNA pseudouridine synthase [Membranihabitans marinus]